jgi:hypothetical protein
MRQEVDIRYVVTSLKGSAQHGRLICIFDGYGFGFEWSVVGSFQRLTRSRDTCPIPTPSRRATALRRDAGRILGLRKGPPVGRSGAFHNGPHTPMAIRLFEAAEQRGWII